MNTRFAREGADTAPADGQSFAIALAAGINQASAATSAAGWRYAITFNTGAGSTWPFFPQATLIGALTSTAVGPNGRFGNIVPQVAAYGVDFANVNFSLGGGCSFRSAGFCVAGNGNLNVGSGVVSPTSAGLSIDSPGRVASNVSVQNGAGGGAGSQTNNYYVGDVVFDSSGGQEMVTTVNPGTGSVTGIQVLAYPNTTGSPPANPLTTTGGSGVGLTLSATWPASTPIVIGKSVNTQFGTGTTYPTTSTGPFPIVPVSSGSPTGVAPAGAIEVDTTNQHVCVSMGSGTWHCI